MGNKATFVPFALMVAVIAVPLLAYAWYEHRHHQRTTTNALREATRLLKQDIRNDIAQAVEDALERISTQTVTPDDDEAPHHPNCPCTLEPSSNEEEIPVFDKREYLDSLNGLISMVEPQQPMIAPVSHATWKHCPSCGMYAHTELDTCDERSHTVAMPLSPINNRELARVMAFLDSDAARREAPDEQARRTMGAFLLQLESVFGVWFEAQAVFDVFDMPDEEQQMFFCFLHDYLDRLDYEHLGLAQQRNVRVQGSTLFTHMHNVTFRQYRGILKLWQIDKQRAQIALQKVEARDAD